MVLYHILQSNSRTFRNLASQSRRRRVYHQCVALYITNTKCCISSSRRQNARWRVMRYKGGSPPLMIYAALCAAMICQACGLDKKILKAMLSGFFGGATRNRTGDRGVADLCLTAWLWRRSARKGEGKLPRSVYIQKHPCGCLCLKKTGTIIRARVWSGLRGSNPPPPPWQGGALPNELNPRKMVPPVGIEPTTRGFSVPCSTN